MPRARPERTRSKASILEDLNQGIERLQSFLPQIEDLGRDGFPYLEGARARTELQLKECVKKTFGDKSPEFQRLKQNRVFVGGPDDTQKIVGVIKGLISSLEDKKLEIQGLKPPPAEAAPISAPARPQMTLVPPTAPTVHVTMTTAAPVVPPPMTVSVPLTTNLDMPTAAQAPQYSALPQPTVPPVAAPAPLPTPPVAPSAPTSPAQTMAPPVAPASMPTPLVPTAPPAASILTQSAPAAPMFSPTPAMQAAPPTPPISTVQPAPVPIPPQPVAAAPSSQEPAPSMKSAPEPAPTADSTAPASDEEPIDIVKSLCRRFHLVARQLRLRGEYRATLDVEDEFDVQDLLHALLRLHFDDIAPHEWTPSYANGAPRVMFVLDDGRLAVVVKKTRTGLGTKDLAEQLRIDLDECRMLTRCATLFCFVYDPEGRIGNPRGLETELVSVSDQLTADVLVAPK